jgi:ABC-2 type transport system permease protein
MFYFMFGNIASEGEFNLARTRLVIANLDSRGAPRLQAGSGDAPGGFNARTLSGLVVEVLQSEDMAELFEVTLVADAAAARAMVDARQADVAVIIPPGFSRQFAELYQKSTIQFYQDPTLMLGPGIVRSILNQFMDGLSGVKIAVDVALDQAGDENPALVGLVIQQYLESSTMGSDDLSAELLDVQTPGAAEQRENPLVRMISPIMGGMMIFYAFFTGAASAESILREEERRTLQRLFTTPTPQSAILSGKFLAVFLTVLVQMGVLITAARLIFGITWGDFRTVALMALGTVFVASSFGIFINSFLKNTKQGGIIFGGVLTFTGMLGMVGIFAMNTPTGARLSNTVALLVPQGWAVRGLILVINDRPLEEALLNTLVMLAWSAVFFTLGVWRFKRRYA